MRKIILLSLLFFLSCSPREIARVMGVGLGPFREQGKVYAKTIDKDIFSTYSRTVQILDELQAQFYRGSRKKNFIVAIRFNNAFKQCSESTEVAIFFIELGPLKTKVEVASLNYSLAEFAASQILGGLEKQTVDEN